MKSIKMFGLAALAALMAMAFVGASSAMAEHTALCSNDGSPCTAVSHVHETSTAKGKLLAGSITVECDVLFLGDSTNFSEEGAPLTIIGNFTYTNCGSCTATEENGPAAVTVLRTGHETSTVTGEGLVHVNCSGLNCRYNGEGLEGTGKGPLLSTAANGEVTISGKETAKESGLFCPTTSKLDLTTTPLSATYLASATTHYCVEYEHEHGHYLEVSNLECKTYDSIREGFYELVEGPAGYKMGDMVCVDMSEKVGLYLGISSIVECKEDSKLDGLYELGVIA